MVHTVLRRRRRKRRNIANGIEVEMVVDDRPIIICNVRIVYPREILPQVRVMYQYLDLCIRIII